MIVRYLDLATGQKAEQSGISEFQLTENNWSCDCNRQYAFGDGDGDSDEYVCMGCHRYIVYDVAPESGEAEFDRESVIRDANLGYYKQLINECN